MNDSDCTQSQLQIRDHVFKLQDRYVVCYLFDRHITTDMDFHTTHTDRCLASTEISFYPEKGCQNKALSKHV